jgi:addiction module HigA family antidote
VEELAARKLTQANLARRMGRPPQTINATCTGKKSITAETALDLERALGIAARVWLGLQAEYDETRARQARQAGPAANRRGVARQAPGGPPAFVRENRLRALRKAKQR